MYELFTTALDLDVIKRRGASYSFNDHKAMGREGFVSLMKSDKVLSEDINTKVRSR
jgi:hypothetical protein